MQKTCKRFLALFVLMLFSVTFFTYASDNHPNSLINQQSRKVTGIVEDNFGPVTGATVMVKGTTNGDITDLDGKFTLNNVEPGNTLVISYVGYVTQEIRYNGETALNIRIQEDNQLLEEVVVVGYGTQRKVNLTGSVSMVGAEVLESRPVQNVAQALQGHIPGLNFSVNIDGGALDNALEFNIRGAGTIGDGSKSSPLVLIDGIEGNMNTVNPNDIESVSVLKDAASASIYGARGSFGVILITTKSGKSGKTNVNYSGNVRFTDALQLPEMMDSYTFARYFNEAAFNSGSGAIFSDEVLQRIQDYQAGKISYGTVPNSSGERWATYGGAHANTDWFSEMYKNWAPSHEHNISISGGTDKLTYRVSGSFMNQNGLIDFGKDQFDRYTMDAKISAKLTNWATMNYTSKWTREDYERPTYMTELLFHNIARRWPTNPVYDPNGYLLAEMETIQLQDGGVQTQKKNYYTQQLAFIFEPIKDWYIHVDGNMRTYNYNRHWEVLPVYGHDINGEPYLISWDGNASYAPGATRVNERRETQDYFTTNIYTDYSKTIHNHFFKILVGMNAELTKRDIISAQGDNLISSSVPYLSNIQTQQTVSGSKDHTSIAGYFARLNYNYKDRYMIELNGRYDGSSRFIGDKRWGFFPSLSVGWNIAREDFFTNSLLSSTISTLKVRGSWGQLGNTETDAWYPFYQSMTTGTNNSGWIINGSKQNTATMPGIISTLMTWETIETWDIGLDWALLSNRLTGSFDYYTRYTYDMIGPAPTLPSVLGANAPKVNNSDMKSYGWELEIGWKDRIQQVSYGARLVLSDGKQKILKYPNETKTLSSGHYAGKMMNEIWGYTTVGIAQSQEQMDAHIEKNRPTWGSNWSAGDIMYADLDGDGIVNNGSNTVDDPGDRRIIGNSTPRYNFGISLDAAWKGFDMSLFLQGVGKRDYWLSGPYFFGASGGSEWQAAGYKEHWDFWRPEGHELGANPNAYYPRPMWGDKNQYTQTGYLQNAAYIRLKNIQFGYTLPRNIVNKAGMQSVRVYFSGDNLLTFSRISGIFDPETLGGSRGDGKLYPLCKTISFGLNVNF